MTVSSSAVQGQEDSGNNEKTSFDSIEEGSGRGACAEHETRSQKFASKSSCESHDGTIKEPSGVPTDISISATGVSTRSSSRPTKRQKTSSQSIGTAGNQDSKDELHHLTSSTTNHPKQGSGKITKKRAKRQWDAWEVRDKNAFFEALNDFGKDFDKIQGYLATKHKRWGCPANLIKNKDQVRHFYYRTLNKISKFIPEDKQPTGESDPHQRTVYELVGLTCYGELRKKLCGGLGEKQGKKLTELIAYGRTSIRHNGRTIRLKAPLCRTLRENELSNQAPPIPQKLLLEFLPVDKVAWLMVQSLAQNPRLKTRVSPKKSVSSVLRFLTNKWPVKSTKTGELLELCVAVPDGFNLAEEDSTYSAAEGLLSTEEVPGNTENTSDSKLCSVGESTSNILTNGESKREVPMEVDTPASSNDKVSPQGARAKDKISTTTESPEKCDLPAGQSSLGSPTLSNNIADDKSWTSETCGNLTVGEVYCRLKRPPKIKFEYSWMEEKDFSAGRCASSLRKLVTIARTEFQNLRKAISTSKSAKECSAVPLSTNNISRTTRIAPKQPFILPSIVPSAVGSTGNFAVPSMLSSSIFSHGNNTRKRPRKSREYAVPAPVQRMLLPRPGSAAPPGAVAVSFIHNPGRNATAHLPSTSTTHTATSKSGTRSLSRTVASSSTSTQVLPSSTSVSSPSPVMPLTPVASPVPFSEQLANSPVTLSEPVTTVIETGVQDGLAAKDTESQAITSTHNVPLTASVTPFGVTDPLVSALPSFPSEHVVSELSTVIGLEADTITNINEDSGSDLLASIMGLSKSTATSLLTRTPHMDTLNNKTDITTEAEAHVEDINSGLSGALQTPYNGFSDLLATSNNEMHPSGVAAQGFLNTTEVNGAASATVVTHDKMLPCPVTTTAASPILSPSLSLFTSPGAHNPWLNGGDTSDSFSSLLDKIVVSPEKERRPVLPETPVVAMDTTSTDFMQTPRHPPIASEMDRALQSMMDENSVDYVKKFQDLVKGFSGSDRYGDGSSSDSSSSGGLLSFRNILGRGSSIDDQ